MTGIAGLVNSETGDTIDKYLITNMLHTIKHRGHHSHTHFVEKTCVFGVNYHKASEKQTVFFYDKYDKVLVIFDGDVFHIRDDTINDSNFSDAEVISKLYVNYGNDFITKIDGSYSIAIFDERQKRLILARDRLGYKPLFFLKLKNSLIFGSEIKAIIKNENYIKEIDLKSLNAFFSYGYFTCPDTIFKGIKQVKPGNMLIYRGGRIREVAYWKFSYFPDRPEKSESYYIEQFSRIMETAISKRIKRYADAGSFLSGGLDSSGVVTIMRRIKGEQFKVFTASFREESHNEVDDAKIVADYLGLLHYVTMINFDRSFPELLQRLVWHHDAPFGDTSAIPTYFAAKLAKEHTDTVLTGDLPDQLLGGSGHHVIISHRETNDSILKKKIRNKWMNGLLKKFSLRAGEAKIFDKIKRFIYRETFPLEEQRILLNMPIPPLLKSCLYSQELMEINKKYDPLEIARVIYREVDSEVLLNKLLYFDTLSWALDDLMVKVERMTSACGLKAISPYHDVEFVEFVSRLPTHLKIRGDERKYIMREALRPMLPEHTLIKRKKGFAMPIGNWLKTNLADFVRDILLDSLTLNRGYFNKKFMKKMVENYLSGKSDYASGNDMTFVCLINFELWHRIFIDEG